MKKRLYYLCLIAFLIISCNQPTEETNMSQTSLDIDIQGHRGARGILPENTIPSFIEALKYGVSTLELDVVISKDSQVIVSHEPWMNHAICTQPDGSAITAENEKSFNLYQLTYEEIKAFDCGSKGNVRFPDQKPMKVHKPSLRDVAEAVATYLAENDMQPVYFNIELKSNPSGDNIFHPDPATFARIVYDEIEAIGIKNYCNVQAFDPRTLEVFHQIDTSLTIALLIDSEGNMPHDFERCLDTISFQPDIYSCHYPMVDSNLVKAAHAKNMKVIPWTVNTKEEMRILIEMGVDGIITDYPNYARVLIDELEKAK